MAQQQQFLWLLGFAILFVSYLQNYVVAETVPCYFIFGDSFAVNGNDDNNPDTYKANYLPYGVDFPGGPNGRFSDGRTMVDIIAQNLGFRTEIPPFIRVGNGSEVLQGANYASSGAILQAEIAGSKVTAISMSQQVKNHQKIVRRIRNILGDKNKTHDYLKSCLYSVGVGSNDYLLDYYVPNPNGSEPRRIKPSEAYAENLVDGYLFNRLNALYKVGARKIAVFGLGPLGCSPSAVTMFGTKEKCVSAVDKDVRIFNSRIPAIIDRFNKNFKDAKFTYINIYNITMATVLPGFKVNQSPCCKVDYNGMCFPSKRGCDNPMDYFYWDGYRPTEEANVFMANIAYSARVPSEAYPFNIAQLVAKAKKN
ncbi:GDSL esterase/lipase At1g29670-like [Jatropha curcas]|uniref:GDSL esterase/lipase At1g29670-like n=1 Tax=Jatropha curcas TaxID=180498 RepID=UPI0005FB5721|nr:GDSL esterase/lipase At1g29670-like [Jatropha curcas]